MLSLTNSGARSWRYAGPDDRDLRIDFMRGCAMVMVVVMHLSIPSLWHLVMLLGLVTIVGAELFVMLAGVSAGISYRARLRTEPFPAVRRRIQARAVALWLVCIAVGMGVWLLEVGGVAGIDALTTKQRGATGIIRTMPEPLLANAGEAFLGVVTLRGLPWPISTLGLYVVLLGVVGPLALWFLARRKTPLLLAASGAVWAVNLVAEVRLPLLSEWAFPLLTWQLLYVIGVTAGWYRTGIVAFGRRHGRWLATIAAAVLGAMALFTLNTPWGHAPIWSELPWWPRLRIIAPGVFGRVYAVVFGQQAWLYPGRLVCLVALGGLGYIALTRWWVAFEGALGWLVLPFGRHSLLVFNAQLVPIAIVAAVPALATGGLVGNAFVHLGAVLLVLGVVRLRDAPGRGVRGALARTWSSGTRVMGGLRHGV